VGAAAEFLLVSSPNQGSTRLSPDELVAVFVQPEAWMCAEPAFHSWCLVGRRVPGYDAHVIAGRHLAVDGGGISLNSLPPCRGCRDGPVLLPLCSVGYYQSMVGVASG
jgi:hypothetical protein